MISNFKLTVSCVQSMTKRFAGHSKWQNIRHTKAAKDKERSMLFIKLGQRIKIAIQETGNNNPLSNLKLHQAIEVAKSKQMPNASIQNCINQSMKDNLKTVYVDLRGPKGTFFIVQLFTETPSKVKNDVVSVAKRFSLSLENNLRAFFDHKGIVTAKPIGNFENIQELAVEHAIESGAEDVQYDEIDSLFRFTCDPRDLKKVSESLKEIGYEIDDAEEVYLPTQPVALEDVYVESLEKVVDKISSINGVVKIYDNIA